MDDVSLTRPARPLRRAEIVAVGSEMLGADRTDTNSLYLADKLAEIGVEVRAKMIVGDDLADLMAVLDGARRRSDLVVVTGGLGPTEDDLTREAVARLLGRPMHEDAAIVERIRERFTRRGMTMPEVNRRQALIIEGARLLPNPVGTAPGQWIDDEDRVVLLVPGPPREMRPMVDALVDGPLRERATDERMERRTVRLAGLSESYADERLRPLYAAWRESDPPVSATILAAFGLIELQLRARGTDPARRVASLDAAVADVVGVFGEDVLSTDGRPLEQVVGDLLRASRLRVALAESCTGGLATARLVDVAGASDYVECAVVAYSNDAKVRLLGVPETLIVEHGAVSEPVALAMAEGARRLAGVALGVGVTGIAGPGGGSETKPVGTVAIAVVGPGREQRVRTWVFPGSRTQVRELAAQFALDSLRRSVLASSRGPREA